MGMSFLIPRMIRKLGLRHLHTIHDVQLVEPSGIILKAKEKTWRYNGFLTDVYAYLMKKLIGSPNVVISPSQFLLDFYTKRGFFPKSQKVMLRNPVPVQESVAVTHKYDDLVFLYLGQIEEHKGVIFLVETFMEMCRGRGFCAQLHMAGDGSQFNNIMKLTKDDKNIILYGRVDRSELSALFAKTNITIVPSLCYENSPTVIFESLSFGVPVLASRVEGVEELISEGENGLTFDTGNRDSLINQIQWCLENRDKLAKMSQNASKSLVGLSLEDYILKLNELYKTCH
jgi:glycosyltransferase involved in cell wall biosynthesis